MADVSALTRDVGISRSPIALGAASAVFPFLDVWRVVAALTVLGLHLQTQGFLPPHVPSLMRIGHLSVVVFFVISGYSVAFSAHQHVDQPRQFLVARWSRIYSIAIPAMLFALMLDQIAGIQNSPLYPAWQYPKWFLGEHWFYNLRPFSIPPYWSLSYEFWFYSLMAIMMLRPSKLKVVAIGALLLFLGPRICLLLPCWLLGVLAYRMTLTPHQPIAKAAWLASIGFLAIGAFWMLSGGDAGLLSIAKQVDGLLLSLSAGQLKLQESRYFLGDYVFALLFSGAILVAACEHASKATRSSRLRSLIGWMAPHTFAIYLFHYTFLAFATAKIPLADRQGSMSIFVALTIFASCLVMGVILAPTRKVWAKWITWALNFSTHRLSALRSKL
jgi:peptidoglycan/LPS O-acetylase OafA/YrhL